MGRPLGFKTFVLTRELFSDLFGKGYEVMSKNVQVRAGEMVKPFRARLTTKNA